MSMTIPQARAERVAEIEKLRFLLQDKFQQAGDLYYDDPEAGWGTSERDRMIKGANRLMVDLAQSFPQLWSTVDWLLLELSAETKRADDAEAVALHFTAGDLDSSKVVREKLVSLKAERDQLAAEVSPLTPLRNITSDMPKYVSGLMDIINSRDAEILRIKGELYDTKVGVRLVMDSCQSKLDAYEVELAEQAARWGKLREAAHQIPNRMGSYPAIEEFIELLDSLAPAEQRPTYIPCLTCSGGREPSNLPAPICDMCLDRKWVDSETLAPKPAEPKSFQCESCGVSRTEAEGGKIFTVCDLCYERGKPAEPKGEAVGEPEKLAQLFHETYERLAPSFNYQTRPESAKPWAKVPDMNKRLMIAVCKRVLATISQGAQSPSPNPTVVDGGTKDSAISDTERLTFIEAALLDEWIIEGSKWNLRTRGPKFDIFTDNEVGKGQHWEADTIREAIDAAISASGKEKANAD